MIQASDILDTYPTLSIVITDITTALTLLLANARKKTVHSLCCQLTGLPAKQKDALCSKSFDIKFL